jgi:galactonate dehydratase
VHALLGGRVRDRVRLYANGPRGTTSEEVAESCLGLVEAGWSALKLAPFEAVPGVAGQRELTEARRRMRLIRDAVGADVDILIDCHGRLSPTAAVQMAEALEEFDIFFFEEPVLPEDPRSMAEVAAAISIPVATGERLFTKWGFRDVLALGAADVLQPDLAHCGGILEARKIAAAAEVSFVGVAPHNPYSWLLTMASIQLDLATPNFLIQEFLVDHPPEVERLFAVPFSWLPGGWVEPPTAPGIGVELDWDAVRAHELRPYCRTYQPSLWHLDGSVADW